MNTTLALIGLGANLGAPVVQIRSAMDALLACSVAPQDARRSSLWRSRPVDCPPGSPDFVNAVLALPVAMATDAEDLLAAMLALELEAGRERSVPNAPRLLDLDLLLVGDRVQDSPMLTLPHPRGHERAFVLLPAAEVAPDVIWPGTDRRIAELARAVPGRDALDRVT